MTNMSGKMHFSGMLQGGRANGDLKIFLSRGRIFIGKSKDG
jgi:hypothetical protein